MNLTDISCPNCGCKIHVEPPELGKNTMPEQPKMDKLGVKTGETCTDTISRQAAIDALRDEFKRTPTNAIRAMDTIKNLPPAQPEQEILLWLLAYHTKSFELHGRYLPHEVIGWLVNDFSKEFIAERREE